MTYSGSLSPICPPVRVVSALACQDSAPSCLDMSERTPLKTYVLCSSAPAPFLFTFLFFLSLREEKRNQMLYTTRGKNPRKVLFSVNFVHFICTVYVFLFIPFAPPLPSSALKTAQASSAEERQRGRDIFSGFPGPDWDRFCVLGEPLPFLQGLEYLSLLGFTQSQILSLRFPGPLLGARNRLQAPLPWSPAPLPQTPTSFTAAAATGSA